MLLIAMLVGCGTDYATFSEQYPEALCGYSLRCSNWLPEDYDACIVTMTDILATDFPERPESYDAERGAACLDSLDEGECASETLDPCKDLLISDQ